MSKPGPRRGVPRPTRRRPYVALRLDADALAWVDRQAAARELNRSEMLREMLAYAQRRMPTPAARDA
jgi:hypothetical protein